MSEFDEETKQKVLEQLHKKPWKYPELAKILKMKKKDVVKIVQELIEEGKAAYWSTGSTVLVASKEKVEEMEKLRSE
ncbi:MAG: sulfite reductase [Archaeoglobaceae archaeon]|nr:sulfite reductase [Archaeoglobaceae archaeon]RLI77640.1 MAG: sulfite reductase [Archaeoglobales archaeon]